MSNRYTITRNVMKEYDKYVFDQKVKREQVGEVSIISFDDWLERKLISNTKEVRPKTEKRKFLDFVMMTDLEYNNLCRDYGEKIVKQILDRLNDYIGSKGDKYQSHYFTIISWIKKGGLKKLEVKPAVEIKKEERQEMTEEQKQKVKEQLQAFRTKIANNGNTTMEKKPSINGT